LKASYPPADFAAELRRTIEIHCSRRYTTNDGAKPHKVDITRGRPDEGKVMFKTMR